MGMQQEAKKLEEKMGDLHESCGKDDLDDKSSNGIKQTEAMVKMFEKELEKNLEVEDKLEHADCWMGKGNKVFRLMMDWFTDEDECGETQKKRKWCRLSKCNEHETLIVVDVGRKGLWWMLKKKDGRMQLRWIRLLTEMEV